jgi:manganese/iron transport system ATP-binding protein
MSAVRACALTVRFGSVTALDDVDFLVNEGEALGIVGPNGSGKSTLLKAVAGLIEPAAGIIEVFGKRPRRLPPGTVGYVPQVEEVDWRFPVSVWDVVAMGRFPHLRPWERFGAHDREVVDAAIEALGLRGLARRHIAQLSGGQQQRTFVARALAQEPRILLLDEPTTGVDAATEEILLALIRERVGRGLPVLMATHDLDRAPEWFDRMIVVDRKILAAGTPRDVLDSGAYAGIREHTHVHGHLRV